mmetsp:Transcript_9739/g.28930  ORF Transcript_9739/g.28930 Transcript_9739/m.28930 type:complete len:244 (+) Transcript_9739:137-868(+)
MLGARTPTRSDVRARGASGGQRGTAAPLHDVIDTNHRRRKPLRPLRTCAYPASPSTSSAPWPPSPRESAFASRPPPRPCWATTRQSPAASAPRWSYRQQAPRRWRRTVRAHLQRPPRPQWRVRGRCCVLRPSAPAGGRGAHLQSVAAAADPVRRAAPTTRRRPQARGPASARVRAASAAPARRTPGPPAPRPRRTGSRGQSRGRSCASTGRPTGRPQLLRRTAPRRRTAPSRCAPSRSPARPC